MSGISVVRTEQNDPWSLAEVEQKIKLKGGGYAMLRGIGFAKRSAADAPNPQVGIELALARAKMDLKAKRDALKRQGAEKNQRG